MASEVEVMELYNFEACIFLSRYLDEESVRKFRVGKKLSSIESDEDLIIECCKVGGTRFAWRDLNG